MRDGRGQESIPPAFGTSERISQIFKRISPCTTSMQVCPQGHKIPLFFSDLLRGITKYAHRH